jgi:hypothetical protein
MGTEIGLGREDEVILRSEDVVRKRSRVSQGEMVERLHVVMNLSILILRGHMRQVEVVELLVAENVLEANEILAESVAESELFLKLEES